MEASQLAPPARILGRRVVGAEAAAGGHTTAWRGRLTLEDGRTVFVKSAKAEAAAPLRREAMVLQVLDGAPFAARLLEWRDGEDATLVIEDLSGAHWPPPYPVDTAPLFDALDQLAAISVPDGLSPSEDWNARAQSRWSCVAAEPKPLLSLQVCSPAWLEQNIDALVAAESRIDLRGDALVHNDVYSGNLCFTGRRCVLVDWGTAVRGNHELDVAFAVLSVLAEGGLLPRRALLADEGAWAARLAGHNALEAPAPLPNWAAPDSTLRQDQLGDLRIALTWAARALGLELPR
jgi:aminoglycoside phosphotransferase (APT) family kinase protein